MTYLRLWKALFFVIFAKPSLKSHLRFWVTPFDCDINWHLNNANFLKLMDVGRYDFFFRSGFMRGFVRHLYRPAAVRIEIDFKKSLPPGTFITLDTTIVGRTEKTLIMRQAFHAGEKLVAEAKVIFVVTHKGRAIPSEKAIGILPERFQKVLLNP